MMMGSIGFSFNCLFGEVTIATGESGAEMVTYTTEVALRVVAMTVTVTIYTAPICVLIKGVTVAKVPLLEIFSPQIAANVGRY
jgi:hypothetical protein